MSRLIGFLAVVFLSCSAGARPEVLIYPPRLAPDPVAIAWAPPPLLVDDDPGDPPFDGAVWVGGAWTWEGDWVWARGHWVTPPEPGLVYQPPYYENRGGAVIFVGGFWRWPGVVFRPPAPDVEIHPARVRPGVAIGPPCEGPSGVFVPPPPGSRRGLIVPAPIGTPPSVVVHAPPVIRAGMRVRSDGAGRATVFAPPGVTRAGRAIESTVSVRPHAPPPHFVSVPDPRPPVAHAPAPPPRPSAAHLAPPPVREMEAERPPENHLHTAPSARAPALARPARPPSPAPVRPPVGRSFAAHRPAPLRH